MIFISAFAMEHLPLTLESGLNWREIAAIDRFNKGA